MAIRYFPCRRHSRIITKGLVTSFRNRDSMAWKETLNPPGRYAHRVVTLTDRTSCRYVRQNRLVEPVGHMSN